MKKLISIKNYKEFWEVFNRERIRRRKKLRRLPFAKKIEIVAKMQKNTFTYRETSPKIKID